MTTKVTKIETTYDLTCNVNEGEFAASKPYLIRAIVDNKNGTLTIKPMHGGNYFEFRQSDKNMVKAIGKLLLAATELEGVK